MPNILKHTDRRGDLSELVGATQRRYNPERLTKIVALRQDLANHRRSEAQLRAVVFTQHLDVHDACVRGLQRDGLMFINFLDQLEPHREILPFVTSRTHRMVGQPYS